SSTTALSDLTTDTRAAHTGRMNFFFDRCLTPRFARVLAACETTHHVIAQDDNERFRIDTPDIEWIATLAEDDQEWALLTGDIAILRKPAERAPSPPRV